MRFRFPRSGPGNLPVSAASESVYKIASPTVPYSRRFGNRMVVSMSFSESVSKNSVEVGKPKGAEAPAPVNSTTGEVVTDLDNSIVVK